MSFSSVFLKVSYFFHINSQLDDGYFIAVVGVIYVTYKYFINKFYIRNSPNFVL